MDWTILVVLAATILSSNAVRLHKLFQFVDGYQSEHNLKGWLHVGNDYAVFLKTPKPHERYLTYELYESKNVDDDSKYRPTLLAVSRIPIKYIKEQLKTFREELHNAKYVDENVVPGTRVKTLREWQIERAVGEDEEGRRLGRSPDILRTIL